MSKWSDYDNAAAGVIADGDTVIFRDVDDTSMAATGTQKELPFSAFKADIFNSAANIQLIDQYSNDLSAAVTAIGATVTTLAIDTSFQASGDITVPSTLSLMPLPGCSIDPNGHTIAINGPVTPCNFQWIAAAGVDMSGNELVNSLNAVEVYGSDIGAKINNAFDIIGKVIIPQGTFSYSTTIVVPDDNQQRVLIGQGIDNTVLTYTATDDSNALEVIGASSPTRAHAVLEDFKLVGNSSAGNGLVIDLGTRKISVNRLFISGFDNTNALTGRGIFIKSNQGNGVTNILSLTDCISTNNNIGLYGLDSNIFRVAGGALEANDAYNVYLDDCKWMQFFGVTIQGSGGTVGTRIIVNDRDIRGPNFFGCWFEETTAQFCIRIDSDATYSAVGVNFYGCEISSSVSSASNNYAIYINSNQDAKALVSGSFITALNSGSGSGTGVQVAGTNSTAWIEQTEFNCDTDTAGTGTVTTDS